MNDHEKTDGHAGDPREVQMNVTPEDLKRVEEEMKAERRRYLEQLPSQLQSDGLDAEQVTVVVSFFDDEATKPEDRRGLAAFTEAGEEMDRIQDIERKIEVRNKSARTTYMEVVAHEQDLANLEAERAKLLAPFALDRSEQGQVARPKKAKVLTVQEAIAPFVDLVMGQHPEWTAEKLHRYCRQTAGEKDSPFSRLADSGALFCFEAEKTCQLASIKAALTAWRKKKRLKSTKSP